MFCRRPNVVDHPNNVVQIACCRTLFCTETVEAFAVWMLSHSYAEHVRRRASNIINQTSWALNFVRAFCAHMFSSTCSSLRVVYIVVVAHRTDALINRTAKHECNGHVARLCVVVSVSRSLEQTWHAHYMCRPWHIRVNVMGDLIHK